MAIAYYGIVGSGAGSGSSFPLALTAIPDGVLLLVCVNYHGSQTLSMSGFSGTQVVDFVGSSNRMQVFWRIAASEPASYTINFSGPVIANFVVLAYSGTHASSPVSQVQTQASTSSAVVTAPAVTSERDSKVVHVYGASPDTNIGPTLSGGQAQRTLNGAMTIADSDLASAGTLAATTATYPSPAPSAVGARLVLWAATAPALAITAPTGTVPTGGPSQAVTWSYAGTVSFYRVRFTNAAGSTTYYDSGTIYSPGATSVPVDLVAAGVPTDTTGSALRVLVDLTMVAGVTWASSDSKALDVQWGVVTASITSPASGAVLTASSVTPAWSFASTRGKAQGTYRVRLLADSGLVLHDSGWVTSAATSYAIPYVLSDLTHYTIGVQLKNSEGVPS
jgi:hypothetical protein